MFYVKKPGLPSLSASGFLFRHIVPGTLWWGFEGPPVPSRASHSQHYCLFFCNKINCFPHHPKDHFFGDNSVGRNMLFTKKNYELDFCADLFRLWGFIIWALLGLFFTGVGGLDSLFYDARFTDSLIWWSLGSKKTLFSACMPPMCGQSWDWGIEALVQKRDPQLFSQTPLSSLIYLILELLCQNFFFEGVNGLLCQKPSFNSSLLCQNHAIPKPHKETIYLYLLLGLIFRDAQKVSIFFVGAFYFFFFSWYWYCYIVTDWFLGRFYAFSCPEQLF